MPELYEAMQFAKHPFSRFSAEEESSYLDSIFIQPRFFDSLSSDIGDGTSRFIVGDRGSGKSALAISLHKQLQQSNCFPTIIDNYAGIPSFENSDSLLRRALERLVTDFALFVVVEPHRLRKLSANDKQLLATLIDIFFQALTPVQTRERVLTITGQMKWNWIRKLYNRVLKAPLNTLLSSAVALSADAVASLLGLPKADPSNFYREYLPHAKFKKLPRSSALKASSLDKAALGTALVSMRDIAQKAGFRGIALFFDKIDEYPGLKGTSTAIADFISDFVRDNSMLQMEAIAFVFTIWSRVKPSMSEIGVRFDKIRPIDVTWTRDDMHKIFEKRIKYFSDGRLTLTDIYEREDIDTILDMSNHSPRDLITLNSKIYDEQTTVDPRASKFSSEAVRSGTLRFATDYDYISFYAFPDIADKVRRHIIRLLKVGKVTFTLSDMATLIKKSAPSVSNYSREMREYGLIEEDSENEMAAKVFKVSDPKIKFLIEAGQRKIN